MVESIPKSRIRLRAMLQQPAESLGINRLTGRKNDRVLAIPVRIYVCPVSHQKFHHRNPVPVQSGAHQRSITALVNIRPVFEHPRRHSQTLRRGRGPGHAALRHPCQGSVFVVPQRCRMQGRISGHQITNVRKVIFVNRPLELVHFHNAARPE